MMKQTLLALCAIAAVTAVSGSVASAQDIHVGPGGVDVGRDTASAIVGTIAGL
jgi:hypothetical protein